MPAPLRSFFDCLLQYRSQTQLILLIFLAHHLLRSGVGLNHHSGQFSPPMYGDYEAQRHWMEITVNLPAHEWYHQTARNDLQYWGLDYPPLTAYVSMLHGYVARWFEPESMALHSSRGYVTHSSKAFMRFTVSSSCWLLFGAIWLLARLAFPGEREQARRLAFATVAAAQGALVLIDHGHFQYNCVCLALVTMAAAAAHADHLLLCAVLYALALNFKQMALYYLPAFGMIIVHACFIRPCRDDADGLRHGALRFVGAFAAAALTTALLWAPLVRSYDDVLVILARLFPWERGLYEDMVANVWCAVSPVLKLKQWYSIGLLRRLALLCTFVALLPSTYMWLWRARRRSLRLEASLLLLASSALSFFLFSYMVREKSLLLPLLPIALLTMRRALLPFAAVFNAVALFTMWPLLRRDDLAIAYIVTHVLSVLFYAYACDAYTERRWRWCALLVYGVFGALHAVEVAYTPPPHLPHLLPLLFSAFGCACVGVAWLYVHWQLWLATGERRRVRKSKAE